MLPLLALLAPTLNLAPWQQLGLAFLLGSFTVATLSDIKHLSAQREFLEVWVAFVVIVVIVDVVALVQSPHSWPTFPIRWGLLLVLCLLSWRPVGFLFRLAFGDVAALAAAACLLPATFIAALFGFAKVFAWALRPCWRTGGAPGRSCPSSPWRRWQFSFSVG